MRLLAKYQKHLLRYLIGLGLLLIFLLHVSQVVPLPFLKQLENDSYDARLNLLKPNTLDNRIVIVDIDDKSLREQGRWPWGRDKLATLIDQLFNQYKIDTLGFDVVFAEKDESSGYKALERIGQSHFSNNASFNQVLSQVKDELDYDQIFSNSLKNRNIVLGYYFSNSQLEKVGRLPAPATDAQVFKGKKIEFISHIGYGANLALLQDAASAGGHFNPVIDEDGIARRVSMLSEYAGQYYEPLSLAVVRTSVGMPALKAKFASHGVGKRYAGLEWLRFGQYQVPVDGQVSTLIPYRGPQKSFQYVSATDVLNRKVALESLKNKIVLVGTTAPGLMDLRATPVQHIYPGVEIHANMIAGILDGNIKQRPAYTQGAEFMMLLTLGLILIYYLAHLSPQAATFLTLGTMLAIIALNLLAWQYAHIVLPLASVLLMLALLYLLNMSYGFFVESRGKRHLSRMFGQYVPPDLVKEMADSTEEINLTGQSREMSVLFTDVRGFTSIAENMPPHELSKFMNAFLSAMTKAIHDNRGTIDKYMGDAIMAFWGAPLADEQHSLHAIEAAFAMQDALQKLNQEFASKNWPTIEIGIGINSGLMTVGNMGSSFRMAYTVMGDAVNLGSRLEGLTKTYGVPIIVSEQVKKLAPEYLYRELDIVKVKGKEQAVKIFQPICKQSQATQDLKDELALHHAALTHYYNQNYDLAEMQWVVIKETKFNQSLMHYYKKMLIVKNQRAKID